jgi:tetratricopeptide (TPR) repeat protein
MEALDALDEQTLAQSGKANLLAGLIHLYRPRADLEAAKLHFERAGALGIGHAFAILGHITIEEGCPDCPARAAVYYKRALEWGDSAEARFGLALALAEQDRMAEALAGFEALLSEETPQYWRLWAASFAGTMLLESDPYRGEAILLTSAAAGFPDAQAALGFFAARDDAAKSWLTRAVANRLNRRRRYQTLTNERAKEAGLIVLRVNGKGYISHAADCAHARPYGSNCLPHAFAHHQNACLAKLRELLGQIPPFRRLPRLPIARVV